MENIIAVEGLSRSFGKTHAVDGLSLDVPEGSIFAFLGPNGAGKTTTIKMLMNILEPSGGAARVLGQDTRLLGPEQLQRIGYVSENQRLPGWMTVKGLSDYCRPMYPDWDEAFYQKLLKQFDLPPDRKIRTLSRGMAVKASLLCSLAYRPRLLILDEPFSGLDPLVRDEFIRGVLELTEQEQWTVFVSSHDIDEVERLADWVGIINKGKLHLSESVRDLQNRFRSAEIVFEGAGEIPRPVPEHWLNAEVTAHTLKFVDTRHDDGAEAALRSLCPAAKQVRYTPMTLREIFLALARAFRISE